MELELTTIGACSPVPDSRRRIEKAHDWLVPRKALSQVLVPVDAGGTHDSCGAGAGPRGNRLWSRADSRGCGSRGGKE